MESSDTRAVILLMMEKMLARTRAGEPVLDSSEPLNDLILENKHLYTHKGKAPFQNHRDLTHAAHRNMLGKRYWQQRMARERSYTYRQMDGLKRSFEKKIANIASRMEGDDALSMAKARKLSRELFRDAYQEAYTLGLRASGAGVSQGYSSGIPQDIRPRLYNVDTDWVKSAVSHELKFWNHFLGQIDNDTINDGSRRFTKEQRIGMYVDALEAQYDSGRVMGAPAFSLIRWVMDDGQENCPSCQYLEGRSPWPKELIITVPRASLTPCRMNCGCTLQITSSNSAEYRLLLRALPAVSSVYKKLQAVFRDPRSWRYDAGKKDLVRVSKPGGFRVKNPRTTRLLK